MTEQILYDALLSTGLPVAYSQFDADDYENESPEPPYIVYLFNRSDDIKADNHNYKEISAYQVELYTTKKDVAIENLVQNKFKELRIPYEKSELRLDTEGLYQVTYEVQII